MPCATLYDFVNGTIIHLPHAGADVAEDGHHGVRPILKPTAEAQSLLQDHARLLVELRGTR